MSEGLTIPAITSGDPLVDAVVELVEGLIADGVHALDPETRKKAIRDAVERERASWAGIVTGSEVARVDAIVAQHHVTRAPTDPAPPPVLDPLSKPSIEAAIASLVPPKEPA